MYDTTKKSAPGKFLSPTLMFMIVLSNITYSPVLLAEECSSDSNCKIGNKCVKVPLETVGVCMKSVDKEGLKKRNRRRIDTVGPNLRFQGECNFNFDCPVGLKCDRKYKVCVE